VTLPDPPPPREAWEPTGHEHALGSKRREGMQGRPPVGWSPQVALLIFLVCFVVEALATAVVLIAMHVSVVPNDGAHTPELVAGIASDVAAVAVLIVWLTNAYPGWVRAIGFSEKGQRLREVRFGLLAGPVVYLFVAFLVAGILSVVFKEISGQESTAPDQVASQSLSTAGWLISVAFAVVVAPITEELLFRGLLFRSIRDRAGFWVGAIVSAVVFGLAHYEPDAWQNTLLLQSTMVFTGLALAWIYQRRGNLLPCIAAHMMFNAIGITLIFTFRG
jgi:uncharacterized protein